uniref:cystathionine beta-synthase n=1 Tax=Pediculus humanus subsp. corporis TaxID=121224 RepID=A0A1S4N1T6_PEDHC
MNDIPVQPKAPIPREILCSGEENVQFIYPCGIKQCTWSPGSDLNSSPHAPFSPPPESQKILPNILHAIGNTPLVRLNNIPQSYGIKCEILAKCEFFNPTGSVKDRIALNMILDAERKNILKPGDTLIEPTAGNTGLGLAIGARLKGYKCLCVMPMRMSTDKVDALKALGAKVLRIPKGDLGTENCIFNVSQKVCRETPHSIILDQFRNPSNPLAHYERTAEEILYQCDGKIDGIVAAAGTGGTLTGIGRKIKDKCPTCKIIGADPLGSKMAEPNEINETDVKTFEMEGIGFTFVPTTLDRSVVSKWYKVSDKDSMLMARRLVAEEGILCGGSSGTAMCAAIEEAKTMSEGERLVVILPDGLRNYMTKFASDPWMKIRGYVEVDEENHWWWSYIPVKVLKLKNPHIINSSATCSQAIRNMTKNNMNHIFVEKNGLIIGFTTSENMLSDLMEFKYKFEDAIENVVAPIKTVNDETPLGKICAILQVEKFVLVETDKIQNGQWEKEIKYVMTNDLLAFISEDQN